MHIINTTKNQSIVLYRYRELSEEAKKFAVRDWIGRRLIPEKDKVNRYRRTNAIDRYMLKSSPEPRKNLGQHIEHLLSILPSTDLDSWFNIEGHQLLISKESYSQSICVCSLHSDSFEVEANQLEVED